MNVLKAIELYEQEEEYSEEDQVIFNRMVNLLLAMDHENLNVEQLDTLLGIVDKIEFVGGDLEEVEERKIYKKSRKSLATTKRYAQNYYRKNKLTLQKKKKKIAKSADGKKRAKNKATMAKQGRTPSGRTKVIYHTKGHTQ